MARPDSAAFDTARYPFSCTIEPRFGDVDANLHINNVALTGILEEARARFHRACRFGTAGIGSMVASMTVEFVDQSFYPDPLDVSIAVSRIGRTSFALDNLVRQGGRPVAWATVILVCVGADGPVTLPDPLRAALTPYMLR